jgi:hypothetical protein
MNNPDHIYERLKSIFWVKILKFFNADPGWKKFGSGMEKIHIRDPGWINSDPGSGVNVPDPATLLLLVVVKI